VYKVAVAYAVVGWLLLQALSILLPAFNVPPWVLHGFIAAIVAGFPLALVFGWAFELTPEGIKRTQEFKPQQSIARITGRKLIATGLKDKEEALDSLEQSFCDRAGSDISRIGVDLFFAPFRGEPRFEALGEKVLAKAPRATSP
jgi:hypothetical protein